MAEKYAYPTYGIDLTQERLQQCCDIAVRLLNEVGFVVPHQRFLSHLRGKSGIRIEGERVHFDEALSQQYLSEWIASATPTTSTSFEILAGPPSDDWQVRVAGFSMAVLDIETEEVRDATCQDLRDLIKLANSYGIGGSYPVMPQDLPPLMRALACFKICWETSETIRPFDYQQPEQTRYLYEMHRVMGQPFVITLCVPMAMAIDPKDIDVFLDFHADWKANRDINFMTLDYAMLGMTKPVTVPGCATMMLAQKLAVHMLFNLFDPEVRVPIAIQGGHATDLRNSCWAFGSPRAHLFDYLGSRIMPMLCGDAPEGYSVSSVLLETSSAAVDEQAALEKMARGLLGAMQGARTFDYAGVLCVDDLFSGVQFVIDVEMVEYIRETIESFDPHPDIVNMDGLFEECRDVSLGKDTFLSHPNTVDRFRNILPSSDRIVREKLRAWMSHRKLLKDRAKEEALERIRAFEPFRLDEGRQRELDRIYACAEAELVG